MVSILIIPVWFLSYFALVHSITAYSADAEDTHQKDLEAKWSHEVRREIATCHDRDMF